jgi:REP element-mobilizing transposase RayT
MARQARIEFPGALYHVISRGIERRELFRDDADRARYLSILEKSVGRFGFRLYAYCLMGNHVHAALEAGKTPLSRIMRSINTAYAGYFNVRHKRSGYLFQGRYKAFIVDREEYLLALIRYIHLNPVKARIAQRVEEYPWSSHQAYLKGPPKWLSTEEVLARFGKTRGTARRRFAASFEINEDRPYEEARRFAQTIVGEQGFAEKVAERMPEKPLVIGRMDPGRLVDWVAREEKIDREVLAGAGRRRQISRLRAICGYLGREVARLPLAPIARELHRGQSTLWRDVNRLEQEIDRNRALRARIDASGRRLARIIYNT